MSHLDRLSALLSSFSLRVEQCTVPDANLLFLAQDAATTDVHSIEVLNDPVQARPLRLPGHPIFAARARLGDGVHPLFQTLPPRTTLHAVQDTDLGALVRILMNELDAGRCGVQTVLDRLVEVVFVQVLRSLMQSGLSTPGMLNGLSDPRLSRALVAIHGDPMRSWSNHELAQEAGFSVSRFAEVFRQKVGTTPVAYLRAWRLTLALQDVRNGARIKNVAARYSYSSGEALSRAFRKHFGYCPTRLRHTPELV